MFNNRNIIKMGEKNKEVVRGTSSQLPSRKMADAKAFNTGLNLPLNVRVEFARLTHAEKLKCSQYSDFCDLK